MKYVFAVVCGRFARWLLRFRGGGSAIPGRVALKIAPDFLTHSVGKLSIGVIFVTGSNGKSTTTGMLSALFKAHGLSVFTNSSGGNLPQGIASSLVAATNFRGRLKRDVAVIEVDEAYGATLAQYLNPVSTLFLNLQIDQLNRFHDPARVADMLRNIAVQTHGCIVANLNDDYVRMIARERQRDGKEVLFFDVDQHVIAQSPNGLLNASRFVEEETSFHKAHVRVVECGKKDVVLEVDADRVRVDLPVRGLHYAVDLAGAVAVAKKYLGERFSLQTLQESMSALRTVYGRGEIMQIAEEEVELIMMKNPPSLQMNLDYLDVTPEQVFVAIDEGTPDPSWLYSIDFSRLRHVSVVSGTKAWQVATCFEYNEIDVSQVIPQLDKALETFFALNKPQQGRKVMIVNYEQMMIIRKKMGHKQLEKRRG